MPQTANFDLPYPSDTDPADVPADMEQLAVAVESALNGLSALGMPVGAPIPWLVSGIPSGFREFDGSPIVAATHPTLYALFGGTIPDLRGRTLLGHAGTVGAGVGDTGGAKEHTVAPTQMPVHAHTVGAHRHVVDSHAHGGGVHAHGVADPGHRHEFRANLVGSVSHGGSQNGISGLNSYPAGNQGALDQLVGTGIGIHNSGATIGAEAPGTSYEAPGTTNAGGAGDPAVTQPINHLPPFRAVRWITRAA